MDLGFLKKSGRSPDHARFRRKLADSRFSHRTSAVKDPVSPKDPSPHSSDKESERYISINTGGGKSCAGMQEF